MKVRPIFWMILLAGFAITILAYTNITTVFSRNLNHLVMRLDRNRHVYDFASVLPEEDLPKFEWYMDLILKESDVDVRFIFLNDTGDKGLEELASDYVQKLRIGGKTGKERGLLLLYDTKGKRLKVEVGYGLEEYFPDALVGYLVHQHTKMFFESGDKSLGLRLLLRMLQYRIREAVLGNAFDPRVLDKISNQGYLSGGAGVSASMETNNTQRVDPRLSDDARNQYVGQDTPNETYLRYLDWLCQSTYDPNVDLFTRNSRGYLSSLPMSKAYHHFILFGEYSHHYRVIERGNLAILYFTNTPLVSPHFFVKENGKWLMDIAAEIQNTKEVTGGIYCWTYMGQGDSYTNIFSDQLTEIRGYCRFKKGDNRALVIRGSKFM